MLQCKSAIIFIFANSKYGRIRMIILKGIESMGFIINIDDLKKVIAPNIWIEKIRLEEGRFVSSFFQS